MSKLTERCCCWVGTSSALPIASSSPCTYSRSSSDGESVEEATLGVLYDSLVVNASSSGVGLLLAFHIAACGALALRE